MSKLDLKKELKHLYLPSVRKVVIVDVPEMQFIMIDGRILAGETPETSTEFEQAIGALYGLSYTLKFMSKLREENPIDYTVMALEGLWWTEKMTADSELGTFDFDPDNDWLFTLMMLQPEHISSEMYEEALGQVEEKRPNPALKKARLENFDEGFSMQIMHKGPYAEEPQTIEKMLAFARENGYRLRGKHHEIYIGDPRRAKPENLKTVLRQPIERIV